MRTISVRLDEHTDALLRAVCEQQGISQTAALKAAIELFAQQERPTPAALARELGLIGAFDSGNRHLGRDHSLHLKAKLRGSARRPG